MNAITHNNTRRFRTRHKSALRLGPLMCAAGIMGFACSDSAPKQSTPVNRSPRVTAESHGLHVVRNADLRTIMNKLQAMHLTEITGEIEMTGELRRDLSDVATMADSLAADAQLMPILLDDSTMTDEARRLMTTMSARLNLEAEQVARAARRKDLPNLRNNLHDMFDTCTDCHREFRAPTLAMRNSSDQQQGL